MMRLVRFLWSGCWHKWVQDSGYDIIRDTKQDVIGKVSYCHCEKCGVRKAFTMRPVA